MTIRTRLAGLPRPWALGLVLGSVVAALALAAFALSMPPAPTEPAAFGAGDAAAYGEIVARMRAGEGYYTAAHAVLLANDYGTASVFNWRTPLYPTFLALLPSTLWAQIVLGMVALLAVWLAHRLAEEGGPWLAGGTALAVALSCAAIATPEGVMFAEVAAGPLILLSVTAHAAGWRTAGIAAGLLAPFVRELAGVYVLVCLALALRARRWREAVAWGAGLGIYAGYFTWHSFMAMSQLGPADRAYPDSWLQFGGLGFILRTASFNGLLFLAPMWVNALLLPLALLGLFAWRRAGRAGLAVLAYLAAFAMIGKPMNVYWGGMYTPLLMLGLCWAVPAVRDALTPRRSS